MSLDTYWKIYYADGSTMDSYDWMHKDVRPFGIVAIVQPDPKTNRCILQGWDWYYWNATEDVSPRWWGCDLAGLCDRLLHRMPTEFVLLGRTVSSTKFSAIMDRADKEHLAMLKGEA